MSTFLELKTERSTLEHCPLNVVTTHERSSRSAGTAPAADTFIGGVCYSGPRGTTAASKKARHATAVALPNILSMWSLISFAVYRTLYIGHALPRGPCVAIQQRHTLYSYTIIAIHYTTSGGAGPRKRILRAT